MVSMIRGRKVIILCDTWSMSNANFITMTQLLQTDVGRFRAISRLKRVSNMDKALFLYIRKDTAIRLPYNNN